MWEILDVVLRLFRVRCLSFAEYDGHVLIRHVRNRTILLYPAYAKILAEDPSNPTQTTPGPQRRLGGRTHAPQYRPDLWLLECNSFTLLSFSLYHSLFITQVSKYQDTDRKDAQQKSDVTYCRQWTGNESEPEILSYQKN